MILIENIDIKKVLKYNKSQYLTFKFLKIFGFNCI